VYDRWFDENGCVYAAQFRLLRDAVPATGLGLEVGTGSGRFASAFSIRHGIDPSRPLLLMAKARGLAVIQGEGEHLPYRAGTFDCVLMMTVICFLENPLPVLQECRRVLGDCGTLVLGFIEREGEVAGRCRQEGTKGRFLRSARFYTTGEVKRVVTDAGFIGIRVIGRSNGICVLKAGIH
jgi:SAM-dependent methyltransferase